MTFEFKRAVEGIFCYLFVTIQFSTANSAKNGDELDHYQNINKLPRANLGDYCLVRICQENQFCNKEFICQCLPGCRVYNSSCIPIAGENEECTVEEDCCGKLVCINGICRKPVPNSEFVTLAKICLGITVTTIIITLFSFLIKCLLRYEGYRDFRRDRNTGSLNSSCSFRGPALSPGATEHEIHDEKPPSYEDCIRSERGCVGEPPPPPYIIFNKCVPSTVENPVTQTLNSSLVQPQNLTSLNVRTLSHEINSNVIRTHTQ